MRKLNLTQVSELAGISKSTIYQYIKKGIFPPPLEFTESICKKQVFWDEDVAIAGAQRIRDHREKNNCDRKQRITMRSKEKTKVKEIKDNEMFKFTMGLMAAR